ncbi:Zinc finger CCCH domain-containing protein 13 [Dichanthelium oligosanthes]|uniref:Zinc finger CCCH domain-containing protein 13 n=1 Tax=Dichanthelium oligosanthes TaxID=888268 RepID=A0A1E5V5A1_9POAL|nr:Zinc finger CCCH domain-containing protein 13 [Dichanthelium oligosanthes]
MRRALFPSAARRTRRSCVRCGGAGAAAPAPTAASPTARPSSGGRLPVTRSSLALDLGDEITETMTLESGLREDTHLMGESIRSRSPIRKSERKYSKSPDSGKNDSSESFRTSDDEDREKDEKYVISDEKNGSEAQVKQMSLDMEALREDKSKLETILEKKTDEERKLCSRVEDLDLQLNKEKEDCQRSQARFERLADLLASDILKPSTKEQGSAGIAASEDPYNANEMSPSDQRQNHVSAWRKRPIAISASEEVKTGKRQRDNGADMIPASENYRPEDALEHVQDSKGTNIPKSFTAKKKLGEGDYNEEGNIVSSSNIFADRYKGDDEEVDVD